MILTLTLNPSIDRTLCVKALTPGREMRVISVTACPGGKGVNVARALRALGVPVTSLTLTDILDVLPRVNTTVIDQKGCSSRFLEPGPLIAKAQWHRVEAAVRKAARQAEGVILSGSLPPGVPAEAYARLVRGTRQAFLDTSGPALVAGVHAAPFLIKPNREEAEALLGYRIRSRAAVRKALRSLAGYGIKRVLLSLGEEGLAGTNGQDFLRAALPSRRGLTVGCGDAALAGFLAAQQLSAGAIHESPLHQAFKHDAGFAGALAMAAAAGAANVGVAVPGEISGALVKSLTEKVVIERL